MTFIYILLLINNSHLIVSSKEPIGINNKLPEYIKIIDTIENSEDLDIHYIIEKYCIGLDVKYGEYKNNQFVELEIEKKVDFNFNTSIIDQEIKKYQELRQIVINYQHIISITNMDHIEEYGFGKFISDYNKYQEFIKLQEKFDQNINDLRRNRQVDTKSDSNLIQLQTYFAENIKGQRRTHHINILNDSINRNYNYYIQYKIDRNLLPKHYIIESELMIKLYELNYFNKKMKKELSEFFAKNGSSDEIIKKLTYLYSNKF